MKSRDSKDPKRSRTARSLSPPARSGPRRQSMRKKTVKERFRCWKQVIDHLQTNYKRSDTTNRYITYIQGELNKLKKGQIQEFGFDSKIRSYCVADNILLFLTEKSGLRIFDMERKKTIRVDQPLALEDSKVLKMFCYFKRDSKSGSNYNNYTSYKIMVVLRSGVIHFDLRLWRSYAYHGNQHNMTMRDASRRLGPVPSSSLIYSAIVIEEKDLFILGLGKKSGEVDFYTNSDGRNDRWQFNYTLQATRTKPVHYILRSEYEKSRLYLACQKEIVLYAFEIDVKSRKVVLEAKRQKAFKTTHPNSSNITSMVEFSPKMLVTASYNDSFFTIWLVKGDLGDLASIYLEPIKTFDAHNRGISSLSFRNGGYLVTGGRESASVKIWEFFKEKVEKETQESEHASAKSVIDEEEEIVDNIQQMVEEDSQGKEGPVETDPVSEGPDLNNVDEFEVEKPEDYHSESSEEVVSTDSVVISAGRFGFREVERRSDSNTHLWVRNVSIQNNNQDLVALKSNGMLQVWSPEYLKGLADTQNKAQQTSVNRIVQIEAHRLLDEIYQKKKLQKNQDLKINGSLRSITTKKNLDNTNLGGEVDRLVVHIENKTTGSQLLVLKEIEMLTGLSTFSKAATEGGKVLRRKATETNRRGQTQGSRSNSVGRNEGSAPSTKRLGIGHPNFENQNSGYFYGRQSSINSNRGDFPLFQRQESLWLQSHKRNLPLELKITGGHKNRIRWVEQQKINSFEKIEKFVISENGQFMVVYEKGKDSLSLLKFDDEKGFVDQKTHGGSLKLTGINILDPSRNPEDQRGSVGPITVRDIQINYDGSLIGVRLKKEYILFKSNQKEDKDKTSNSFKKGKRNLQPIEGEAENNNDQKGSSRPLLKSDSRSLRTYQRVPLELSIGEFGEALRTQLQTVKFCSKFPKLFIGATLKTVHLFEVVEPFTEESGPLPTPTVYKRKDIKSNYGAEIIQNIDCSEDCELVIMTTKTGKLFTRHLIAAVDFVEAVDEEEEQNEEAKKRRSIKKSKDILKRLKSLDFTYESSQKLDFVSSSIKSIQLAGGQKKEFLLADVQKVKTKEEDQQTNQDGRQLYIYRNINSAFVKIMKFNSNGDFSCDNSLSFIAHKQEILNEKGTKTDSLVIKYSGSDALDLPEYRAVHESLIAMFKDKNNLMNTQQFLKMNDHLKKHNSVFDDYVIHCQMNVLYLAVMTQSPLILKNCLDNFGYKQSYYEPRRAIIRYGRLKSMEVVKESGQLSKKMEKEKRNSFLIENGMNPRTKNPLDQAIEMKNQLLLDEFANYFEKRQISDFSPGSFFKMLESNSTKLKLAAINMFISKGSNQFGVFIPEIYPLNEYEGFEVIPTNTYERNLAFKRTIEKEYDNPKLNLFKVEYSTSYFPVNTNIRSKFTKYLIEALVDAEDQVVLSPIKMIVRKIWTNNRWIMFIYATIHWAMVISFCLWMVWNAGDPDYDWMIYTTCLYVFCLVFYEVVVAIRQGRKYISSLYNYVDLYTFIAIPSLMLLRRYEDRFVPETKWISFVVTLTMVIGCLRALTLLSVFDRIRYLIAMLFQVFVDMIPFLTILTGMVLSFAVIQLEYLKTSRANNLPTFANSIDLLYNLAYGDWGGTDTMNWVEYFHFLVQSVLLPLIMLNLLITIIGGTYEEFEENKEIKDNREVLKLLSEFSAFSTTLFGTIKTGSGEKYLQIIAKAGESEEESMVEKEIKDVKRRLRRLEGIEQNQEVIKGQLKRLEDLMLSLNKKNN